MRVDYNHWKYPWPVEAEKGDVVTAKLLEKLSMGPHQISQVSICDSYTRSAYGDSYDVIHYLREEIRCSCGDTLIHKSNEYSPTDLRAEILWHVVSSWYKD